MKIVISLTIIMLAISILGYLVDSSAQEPIPTHEVFMPIVVKERSTPMFTFNCSGDVYNCPDFPIKTQAGFQEYLRQCGSDLSKLDADNDGLACESSW